jgi:tetratricopeptide (TPR) repeat protein
MALEARGDVVEARRELRLSVDAARRARANPWLFSRIGVAMARAGMVREASGLLGEVRPGSGDASPEQLVDLHRLEGEIAMARGGHAAAIDLLARADGGHRSAFTVESLARAQRLAGHRDEATRLYRTLIGMVTMALGFEPQQGWLEAHYWLALMQAQAGQRDRAAETAGALLALWREADDDLPLLPKLKALAAREE